MTNLVESHVRCPNCGHVWPIWRLKARRKKVGHVKHMYCPVCKEDTAHREIEEEYDQS